MYDYVIVGAGSAGCVLAHRLTEDPDVRVLLLEAGPPADRREVAIPAAFSKLFKTDVDWDYTTVAQEALDGRELYWPRGKMLGGSSSINSMIYIRGNPADYDAWEAAGAKGWSSVDVLPYFERAENNERGPVPGHGVGGPLDVADLRHVHELTRRFVRAGTEIGLPHNDDFNVGAQEGVGVYQVTQKGGKRASTATAYLGPAMKRDNLDVVTDAHATRILLEDDRAVGVEFAKSGVRHTAHPVREVLVSAGAVNSPQLLLLSGIGPADELRAVGIQPRHDLPGVGRNLQDHLAVGVMYRSLRDDSMLHAEHWTQLVRYLLGRRGMLTSNLAEAGAFLRVDDDAPAPDIQLHFGATLYEDHGLVEMTEHGFSLGPCILEPRSRGRITVTGDDPFAPPRIEPNYLSDPAGDDLRRLVAGVKLCRDIVATAPFDGWRGEELWPGAQVTSDADLADFVRARSETLYHPAGTCAMGVDDDAVVDPDLRVHGLTGLRVIDASVMPKVVRGNTNAPAIMIGEKAADLIRGHAGAAGSVRRAHTG